MTPDGAMTVAVTACSMLAGVGAAVAQVVDDHRHGDLHELGLGEAVKAQRRSPAVPLKADPKLTDVLGAAGRPPRRDRAPFGYYLRKRLYGRERWLTYLGKLCDKDPSPPRSTRPTRPNPSTSTWG